MGKKLEAAADQAVELSPKFTLKLARPIDDGAGLTWDDLTIAEPTLGHRMTAERASTSEVEQVVRFFALLSGVPEEAIQKLKTSDARKLNRWVDGLPLPKWEAPTVNGDRHTFKLLCPIEIEGQVPISEITLREPDLAAGIAVEKFKSPREQTAASIASLSGLTIPVVRKMKMRDVERIEAWMLPFVAEPDLKAGDGET